MARRFNIDWAHMESMDRVICRKCGAAVAIRISRSGFLQRNVLTCLGLYPWKCGACGCAFLFRSRGLRPRSRSHSPGSAGHNESPQT